MASVISSHLTTHKHRRISISMEVLKPVEMLLDRTKSVAGFILYHILGGSWGELGGRYGQAVGGHEPHPASIQIISTPEDDPDPTPPAHLGLRLRTPPELGWEYKPRKAA